MFGEPLPTSTKMNTHDDLNDIHRDPDADSDIDLSLADQMESTLTVRTATGEDGRDEIRVNTWRTQRPETGDGEFEVLEDDDSES